MYLYLFLLALSAQILCHFAYRAWRNRMFPGFLAFAVAQTSLVLWIVFYLGEQLDPEHARWWFLGKFLWIGLAPPSMFLYVLRFTGTWTKKLGPWLLVYLWALILPFLTLTNDLHHLFFREIVRRNELVGLNGPLFLFHTAFNYSLLVLSMILLARSALRGGTKRATSVTLLLAFLIPLSASLVNELTKSAVQGSPLLAVNPTLPSFIITTMTFGWAVFRQRLLDPRPLAREKVFNLLPEGLVVLDPSGLVVDVNEFARGLFQRLGVSVLGYRLEDLSTPLKAFVKAQRLGSEFEENWTFHLGDGQDTDTFSVHATPLRSSDHADGGTLLTIRSTDRPANLVRMDQKGLTVREQEMAEWVYQGLSNKEIAILLDISAATVKNHIYNVFRKCGVGSRKGLIRIMKGVEVEGLD